MVNPPPIDIILDTDVLLGLIKSGRISILGQLTRFRFYTTDVNEKEVLVEGQKQVLAEAVDNGWITIVQLTDLQALQVFAKLRQWQLHNGESAAIAQALAMNARVAMHDNAGRRAARVELGAGHAHRLEDIIVEALREKVLTPAQCDEIITTLRGVDDYWFDSIKQGFAAIATDATFGIPP